MTYANTANAYKNQQIMTAPPGKLTLMLYDGALRFVTESIRAMEQGDFNRANNANLRAQDIVREFMCTLDMKYEISKTYMALYDFICRLLIEGNVKKDKQQLEDAKGLLTDLRDAWAQAIVLARQTPAGKAI